MAEILVVDDDVTIRNLITEALEREGMEYEEAQNGREALQKLAARADDMFDCILLDIEMPQVNGWDVLKAVRSNPLWADTPVLVLTGYANSPDDVARITEYDGVYVEKKGDFLANVGMFLKRMIDM
ncbi:MAG: response regulator [Armatimonadota bacterium]